MDLPLTHVVRLLWTTGDRSDRSSFLNGFQSVQTDDLNVICQGQRPVHVFLALIEQSHAVFGVEMSFFLGRRDQTCRLGDRCSLGLQFQEAIFKLVKPLSKRLSLCFLFITDRPSVDGVPNGQEANRQSTSPCHRIQLHRLRQSEDTSGSGSDPSQNGSVPEHAEMATHRGGGSAPTDRSNDEQQPATNQSKSVTKVDAKGPQDGENRP